MIFGFILYGIDENVVIFKLHIATFALANYDLAHKSS